MNADLRVALLDGEGAAEQVREALAARGHHPVLVGAPAWGLAERVLAQRGFTPSLTALPGVLAALRAERFDVAHAFSPVAALAARLWRRGSGGPVVYTCAEMLGRPTVADRRLRLALLSAALEGSDALTATTDDIRSALWRWMAVEADRLAPADGAAHEALYTRLLAARRGTPS